MKLSRRVKWTIGIGVPAAALVMLVTRPEVVQVDLTPVEPGPLSVTIDEDGMTRIRRHAEIAAPVTGRLLASTLRAGDSVRRGQVVAQAGSSTARRTHPGTGRSRDCRGRIGEVAGGGASAPGRGPARRGAT